MPPHPFTPGRRFFAYIAIKRRLNDKMIDSVTLGELLILAQLALINFALLAIYNEIKKGNAGRV